MTLDPPKGNSCKAQTPPASLVSRLGAITSSSTITRCLAFCAASALVVASAGFGAVYAWTTGSQYGVLLGGLTVLMAVSLDALKPLAFAIALRCFRSWDLIRGAALVLLALVAVVYSLTSALTLLAGARGDVVASRAAEVAKAKEAGIHRDRIQAELASLGMTRPAATIKAELSGMLSDPRVGDCSIVNGPRSRASCPKVSELRAELGKAGRRDLLEGLLDKSADLHSASIGKADPGASALATYLAALNINVGVSLLTEWIVLVPVLAMEMGSLLAGIVAQAVSAGQPEARSAVVNLPAEALVVPELGHPLGHPANTVEVEQETTERERVKGAIVAQLRASGGSLSSSSRGLAKKLGAGRATLRRAMDALVVAGVVVTAADRNGTLLRLVA